MAFQNIPVRKLAAVLAIAFCSQSALGQPYFFRQDIVVGEAPRTVVPGDFNGDGRRDLAVDIKEGLAVLLNTGGGNFGRAILTETQSRLFWLSQAADFNGDGKDDLIGSGFLLISRGDGTFLPRRWIEDKEAVAAGDFNRDGKMDLLIAYYWWVNGRLTTIGVHVLLGSGDGAFRPGADITSVAAAQLRLADFNRDGAIDIAMLPVAARDFGPDGSTTLLVFLGRADGTFGPEIRTTIQGTHTRFNFLVADFNTDGLPDVFTVSGILLGRGDGAFQTPVPYTADERSGFPIAAADFTGDGRADLIMTYGLNSIATCTGKGDGTFLAPAVRATGSPGSAIELPVATDLDGDGRLDLIAANLQFFNTVSVFLVSDQEGPRLRRAVSAANGTAVVAPESLATLYAPTPASAGASASPPWPTRLGGIGLEVLDSAGVSRPAPLLYVSPTQINFRVPAGTALGEATLLITVGGGTTEAGSMHVDAIAPALFQPVGWLILAEPDGTQVLLPLFTCFASELPSDCELAPIPLSAAGDRPIYLRLLGTGFQGANPGDVTCSINGMQVPVIDAGPQTVPGLDQINIRLLPKLLETLELCGEVFGCELSLATLRFRGVPGNSIWLSIQ